MILTRKKALLKAILLAVFLFSCDDSQTDYDAICAELQPTGNGVGDVAENWTLNDAQGNPHSLHEFCGYVVYLKVSTQW